MRYASLKAIVQDVQGDGAVLAVAGATGDASQAGSVALSNELEARRLVAVRLPLSAESVARLRELAQQRVLTTFRIVAEFLTPDFRS